MALTQAQQRALPGIARRLGALAGALPEASAAPAGRGHTAYRRGKRSFAYLMVDHHGDGRVALAAKSTPEEQQGLVAEEPERYFVPAYLGAQGWVALRLDPGTVDWAVVEALLTRAHAACAPKRRRGRAP